MRIGPRFRVERTSLVYSWNNSGHFKDVLEMICREVRDADRLGQACRLDFLHAFPDFLELAHMLARLVDQVQVYVFHSELLQGFLQRTLWGFLRCQRPQLRCDVQL